MRLKKLAAAVLVLSTSSAAIATITVTPLAGYTHHEHPTMQIDQQNLKAGEGYSYGVSAGYEFAGGGSQLQLEYLQSKTDNKLYGSDDTLNTKIKSKGEQYNLNLIHDFGDSDSLTVPYGLIGVGHAKTQKELGDVTVKTEGAVANLGLGVKRHVNKNLALRGELRAGHYFEENKWEGQALLGAELRFNSHSTPTRSTTTAKPQTSFTSLDLVRADIEPLVVIPSTVDQYLDQDGDGVPDHLDLCHDTPRNLVVDERGCPKSVKVVEELKMELRVFFDKDKADLKSQFKQEVAKVAEQMYAFPNATVKIEGHSSKDSAKSSPEYNQRLSQARAEAVRNSLIHDFGISPDRISAAGYGFDRPLVPNTTEEGRSVNRRVYAIIHGERIEQIQKPKVQ